MVEGVEEGNEDDNQAEQHRLQPDFSALIRGQRHETLRILCYQFQKLKGRGARIRPDLLGHFREQTFVSMICATQYR